MARKGKTSDDVYNARRRYKRQAARLRKEASKQGGIVATRLNAQADYLMDRAKRLYQGKSTPERQKKIEEESLTQTVSYEKGLNDEERRKFTSDRIMKTVAGRRIYAATTDIWEDSEYTDRDIPIIAFFNAEDMMQVIEIFEQMFGEDLYKESESEDYPSDSATIKMMLEISRYKSANHGQEV